jgi:hypothetical protein
LRERRDSVGFISDIDENFAAGDLENPSFYNLVAGGRREMTVILEQMLIIVRIDARGIDARGIDARGLDGSDIFFGPVIVCQSVNSRGSRHAAGIINYSEAAGACQTR